ncbi:MAG: TRAP transporter large permease [Spirochaetales bacterium]|jgi:C4-dicarboxylate transporter DctM subunit|nr:TRAP transporter large permease [Spirochaetales bacterium]
MIGLMLLLFLILMLLGIPMAFSTTGAVVFYILNTGISPELIPQRFFTTANNFALMAIPLFMIAGELMNSAGITKRIVRLSSALVGHIRGSLAHVTIVASMIFAGMSGSSAAACASVGSMLIPVMKDEGYDSEFGAAVTCCASCLGPIIPPSITFIVYGSVTGDSIGKLFLGGIIPGVIMGLCLMTIAFVIARKRGYPVKPKSNWKERYLSLKSSIAALMMPVIIMGGILSGVFTATEAGAIGVAYGLLVGVLNKELKLKMIPRVFINGAITTAAIMMVMASSQILGWILTSVQLPQQLTGMLLGISENPKIIIFVILGILLFLGCFMVDAAIIPIMAPLFMPVVKKYGIDPIHFGVVMSMMTVTGGVTPPVGNLLFIACGISGAQVGKTAKAIVPFVAALLISMVICAMIPQLVTFIPNLFFG